MREKQLRMRAHSSTHPGKHAGLHVHGGLAQSSGLAPSSLPCSPALLGGHLAFRIRGVHVCAPWVVVRCVGGASLPLHAVMCPCGPLLWPQ